LLRQHLSLVDLLVLAPFQQPSVLVSLALLRV
jgi:hypothetical protein